MFVLVTGGAGFIGSHTTDSLLKRGHKVRILDALVSPVHEEGTIPTYVPVDDVEFILGDVTDRDVLYKALDGVEAVIHLAAYQDYLPDFSHFIATNVVSTALLYEIVVERGLELQKVVVASSQSVYGEGLYHCPEGERDGTDHPAIQRPELRSEDALRRRRWDVACKYCGSQLVPEWTTEQGVSPHNAYSLSKYGEELVALTLGRRYDIPTVSLRYSIVQGPRQSFRNAYSGVLRIFTQQILTGRRPICYEDGQQLRDYVSVHDVVRANLLVLEQPSIRDVTLNVGGDRRISVYDYAELVCQRASRDLVPEIPGIYRFGDTRHVFSDVSKIKSFGWAPTTPLEEIVDSYRQWTESQSDFRDYSQVAEARMKTLGTIRSVS